MSIDLKLLQVRPSSTAKKICLLPWLQLKFQLQSGSLEWGQGGVVFKSHLESCLSRVPAHKGDSLFIRIRVLLMTNAQSTHMVLICIKISMWLQVIRVCNFFAFWTFSNKTTSFTDASPSGEARAAELKKTKTGESDIMKRKFFSLISNTFLKNNFCVFLRWIVRKTTHGYATSWALSKYYNPETTTRESTITSLFAQLQRVRLIHICGTPVSGKSRLCRLLYHHVKSSRSDIDV